MSGNEAVARKAAVTVMEEAKASSTPKNEVTLSSGVVLGIKPVPMGLVRKAAQRVPRPKMPETWLEDKGISEPNPNHPEYLAAVQEYNQSASEAGNNVILGMGTLIKSIPKGMHGPDGNEWIRAIEFFLPEEEIELSSPMARYLSWLNLYALGTATDLFAITKAVMLASAISEEEVDEAVASFSGGEGRGTNNGVPTEA